MKLHYILSILALLAVSCVKEISSPDQPVVEETVIESPLESITIGAVQTKTSMGESNAVLWSPLDKLSILYTGYNQQFTIVGNGGGESAFFTGEADGEATLYALYPYNASAELSGENIITEIPAVQEAVPGSFANGVALSVGEVSKSGDVYSVSMLNVCALLKITLANSAGIKSILISGTENEPISGKVSINPSTGAPTMQGLQSGTTVELTSGSESALADGTYYVAVAPVALSGIRLLFTNTAGKKALRYSDVALTPAQGGIKNIKTVDAGLVWRDSKTVTYRATQEGWNLCKGDGESISFTDAQTFPDFTVGVMGMHCQGTGEFFTTCRFKPSINECHVNSDGYLLKKTLDNETENKLDTLLLYREAWEQLISVSFKAKGAENLNPKITNSSKVPVLGGAPRGVLSDGTYTWNLSGTTGDQLLYMFMQNSGDVTLSELSLEYLESPKNPEAVPSAVSVVEPADISFLGDTYLYIDGVITNVSGDPGDFYVKIAFWPTATPAALREEALSLDASYKYGAFLHDLEPDTQYSYQVTVVGGDNTLLTTAIKTVKTATIALRFGDPGGTENTGTWNYSPYLIDQSKGPEGSEGNHIAYGWIQSATAPNVIRTTYVRHKGLSKDNPILTVHSYQAAYNTGALMVGVTLYVEDQRNPDNVKECYLAFPAIEGKKLVKVRLRERVKCGIYAGITTMTDYDAIAGGNYDEVWKGWDTSYRHTTEWNLTETVENTQYCIRLKYDRAKEPNNEEGVRALYISNIALFYE